MENIDFIFIYPKYIYKKKCDKGPPPPPQLNYKKFSEYQTRKWDKVYKWSQDLIRRAFLFV